MTIKISVLLFLAAISAAAHDSRAAALIYESASGHVTVTSQHSALPLDQGTSVRPSSRLPSDLNKPEGSLVTGKPAEEKSEKRKEKRDFKRNYYYYYYLVGLYMQYYKSLCAAATLLYPG